MVKFTAHNHKYESIIPDGIEWVSVTTLVKNFTEPFDAPTQALKSSKNKRSKWYGMDPDEICAVWERRGTESADFGTKYHKVEEDVMVAQEYAESFGKKVPVFGPAIDEFGIKYAPEQRLREGIYPEHLTFLKSYGVCGQADLVEVVNDTIHVSDHKTYQEVKHESYKDWTGRSKRMLPPLVHLDDCVSGDTRLLTREGIESIGECVGKKIEIWNGESWSEVSPFETGIRDLYRVVFSDGSHLDVTDNHVFLIKYRRHEEFQERTTEEIIALLNNKKSNCRLRVPHSNVVHREGICVDFAYDLGFILGDGTVDNKTVKAELWGEKRKIKFSFVKDLRTHQRNNSDYDVAYFDLDSTFARRVKYDKGLPSELFAWSRNSILNFVSGWADADGTVSGNGIRIYGAEDKMRDLQLLLTKCGVSSSVKLMGNAGDKTNLGVRRNSVYYVQITDSSEFFTRRLPINIWKRKNKLFKSIRAITKLEGKHPTYCLTEPVHHRCVFNNILTKQCNKIHCNLQLSILAYQIHKHNPHFKVGDLTLRHIQFEEEGRDQFDYPIYKLDFEGNPIVKQIVPIKLPYMKREAEFMLDWLSKNRDKIRKKS